ncbi:hypothetical protein FH972_025512 [Carpinus fangiana]|uniref:Major facilitator superfamily (MFS) profile domain-containing protein n=1 Tax=Carpinus fangiana TaxID=176857 RepID=A0A5N6L1M1_9ROSI|nr:hypothetical protein FH972_025512 [Carpinus fangiana]
MASNETDDPGRRASAVSVASQPLPNETSKLLDKPATQASLYRTIRRQSHEHAFLQPDDNDSDSTSTSAASQDDPDSEANQSRQHRKSPWGTLSILLLGVFVSQLDQSLVLATYGKVASEFHELDSGVWIMSAYILAQCAVQPLYGKLSGIYSRKACLLTAYALFTIGTAGAGLSRGMREVIAWRAVQGAGGSGMVSIVSIVITDIVPKHEVSTMTSYVNVLQTMGRSCGGVVGGLLTQAVGWRWAFLVQVPPMFVAIGMVAWSLRLPVPSSAATTEGESQWAKLKRVDFFGAISLLITILAICLALDLSGQGFSQNSTYVYVSLGVGFVASIIFVISAKLVREPIFPLKLLIQWNAVSNFAVILLSTTSQMSLMSTVPIYFQATSHASTAAAGAYLIPAFAGNTLGGLLSGYWIKKTGRYKAITVLAPLLALLCSVLLILTWKGRTTPAESTFIFSGGFAMGIILNSAFVGLVANVAEEDVAIAASGMYLFFNIGSISGVSAGSAAMQAALRSTLESSLDGIPNKKKLPLSERQILGSGTIAGMSSQTQLQTRRLRNLRHSVSEGALNCGVVSLYLICLPGLIAWWTVKQLIPTQRHDCVRDNKEVGLGPTKAIRPLSDLDETQPAPILRLPLELRYRIFELVLCGQDIPWSISRKPPSRSPRGLKMKHNVRLKTEAYPRPGPGYIGLSSLPLSGRQLYHETIPMLYGKNTFSIFEMHPWSSICLGTLPLVLAPSALKAVSSVRISWAISEDIHSCQDYDGAMQPTNNIIGGESYLAGSRHRLVDDRDLQDAADWKI